MRIFFLILLLAAGPLFAQNSMAGFTYKTNLGPKTPSGSPVVLLMHGYGSNEDDLMSISSVFGPGAVVFSLRAPFQLNSSGYCWFKLGFSQGEVSDYNYRQAAESAAKVLKFLRQVCRTYKLDTLNIFIGGFSQGAIMSYEIVAQAPHLVKGVFALSGRMLSETGALLGKGPAVRTSFFIAHGSSDTVIRPGDGKQAYSFLLERKKGKPSYHEYPIAHTISQKELQELNSWFRLLNGIRR